VDVLLLLGLEYHSETFVFLVFFLFWMSASVLPLGYCIVAEAGCNLYLSILIYSLYKKKCHHMIAPNQFKHDPAPSIQTKATLILKKGAPSAESSHTLWTHYGDMPP
jgi:hypothetical protein